MRDNLSIYITSFFKFYHAESQKIYHVYQIDWERGLAYCQDDKERYMFNMNGNRLLKALDLSDSGGCEDIYEGDIIGIGDEEENIVIGFLAYENKEWIVACDEKFNSDYYVRLIDYYEIDGDGDENWVNGCRKLGNKYINDVESFHHITLNDIHFDDEQ